MLASLKKLRRRLSAAVYLVFVIGGLLFGRSAHVRLSPSIPERIAAVQKAVQEMPAEVKHPFLVRAQWGNWGNWNNWANWANWNNWNNWGNWGNFRNY
jgi:hypothetical protein